MVKIYVKTPTGKRFRKRTTYYGEDMQTALIAAFLMFDTFPRIINP